MPKILLTAAALLALSTSSFGAFIETEGNDSFASADSIVSAAPSGGDLPFIDAGFLMLEEAGDDIDFFTIDLMAGQDVLAESRPFFPDGPTTILAVYEDGAPPTLLDSDVDPTSDGSVVRYTAPADGTYYIAVTGEGNESFEEGTSHGETGYYTLTLAIVPEPATMSLLGLAGLALLRRR
jgi:hypothetical protein